MSTHTPLSLKLYNTLTQQVEPFEPQDCLEPGKVRMYVCGPTVYDDAHLGHARCYITWDVLYRFLQFAGYDVTYVRNVTDVDDKILKRAAERDITPKALSEQYYESFLQDMDALNVLRPKHEPKAMDYIQEMVEGIQVLIDKGAAYVTPEGTVYYDTASKADYGKLSKKPLDDLLAGARVDVDPHKKNPTDFALWKHVDDSDTTVWDTPWGKGRPGWHMECSAMSRSILGDQIDIHCGGSDLIFPHHENEIAQSEAWTGKDPFVQVWMHNGFVNVSGEKMSKSLGNFATVKTMLQRYDANTIRYFLLRHHYRMPVDFNEEALQSAENRMIKIKRYIRQSFDDLGKNFESFEGTKFQDGDEKSETLFQLFKEDMQQDLNTPKAISQLDQMASILGDYHLHYDLKKLNQENIDKNDHDGYQRALNNFIHIFKLLGFNLKQCFQDIDEKIASQINKLIEKRSQAKAEKNWTEADAVRNQLTAMGVLLKDNKDGTTTWEYKPVQDTQPVG